MHDEARAQRGGAAGGARGADAQHPGGGRDPPDRRDAGEPRRPAARPGREETRRTWSRPSWRSRRRARCCRSARRSRPKPIKQALSQLQMAFAREAGRRRPARRRPAAPPRPGEAQPSRPSRRGASAPRPAPRSGRRPARELSAVGIFGGSGFYQLPRRRRGGGGRHALRPAVGAHPDRRDRGHARWPSCRATATSTRCRRTGSTTGRTSGR